MNRTIPAFILAAALAPPAALAQAAAPRPAPRPASPGPSPRPQTRPHSMRVPVDPALVQVDDGDTVVVRWSKDDLETVRILGIDTPETRHLEHDLPYAQPFGPEARAFARGAFATATQVELLRSRTVDPYGRTLGYLFLNGRNYSVLVVAGAPRRRERDLLRRQRSPERGGRGPRRGEVGRPASLRAAPRLPRPDEGRVEVDEGEGARARAVGLPWRPWPSSPTPSPSPPAATRT